MPRRPSQPFKGTTGSKTNRGPRTQLLSLVLAVGAICLVLVAARFVTVLITSLREEPDFSAPKTIYLPQRELEHAMAVAEFQNAAASPASMPALTTESLLATAPPLPQIPDVDFTPVESEAMVTEADSLFGESGLMGDLGALTSEASSVSFLGIREEASRFVIVMDISASVVNSVEVAGMQMDLIREEAKSLINTLNANTLFGFVQHSRKFDTFGDHLLPATMGNKEAAVQWLEKEFRTSGTSGRGWRGGPGGGDGIVPIIDFVFGMQPDVIFLISDGGYFTSDGNRPVALREVTSLIRDRQKDLPADARIHCIHFTDPRDIQDGRIGGDMRRIAGSNDGEYRKMEE